MYEKCQRFSVIGSALRYVHVCICVCMRVYMRARTSAHTFAAQGYLPNNVQVRAHKKRTVSHDTRCHGLEVLLLLVKNQRGIWYWVVPNTSPYGGVGSRNFLELLKKNPEGAFFAVP